MRDENEKRKPVWLISYVDGEEWAFHRAKCRAVLDLTEKCHDFGAVCKWLVHQFAKAVDPDELIPVTMRARLDNDDFIKSLSHMNENYYKGSFNDKAKYHMIKKQQ